MAKLAHLELSEAEVERIASELQIIADSVAKVSEIATDELPATSHPIPLRNVMREDVVGPCLDRDEVLAAAPDAVDGQFKVPQILGEE